MGNSWLDHFYLVILLEVEAYLLNGKEWLQCVWCNEFTSGSTTYSVKSEKL